MDAERLWITIFETDDEAHDIWLGVPGVRDERVQRLGYEDNFWQMGDTGPCGPCSELFFDRGPQYGDEGGPAHGGADRFVEIYTLVFMQHDRALDGSLSDLPYKSIDTGRGSSATSPFSRAWTRSSRPRSSGLSWRRPRRSPVLATAPLPTATCPCASWPTTPGRWPWWWPMASCPPTRAGATSCGASSAAPCAGPSSWECSELVTPRLVAAVADVLGDAYPVLANELDRIQETVEREEGTFRRTLEAGSVILEEALRDGTGRVPGDVAFRLHDTHGFPIELTMEMAAEAGVEVDTEGFEREMAAQRDLARADARRRREALGRGHRLPGPLGAIGPDALHRLRALRGAHHGGGGADRCAAGHGGDRLGPHPVLRRVRRPGGRHRRHHHRDRACPGARHPGRGAPGSSCTAPRWRASCSPARTPWPSSTPAVASPPAATTPGRTCCTRLCARSSATTSASRAPTSPPTGCASTSPIPQALRREELAEVALVVNADVLTDDAGGDHRDLEVPRLRRWGPSPSSTTSTASASGWCGPARDSLELCGGTHVDALGMIGPDHGGVGGVDRVEYQAHRGRDGVGLTRAARREPAGPRRRWRDMLKVEPNAVVDALEKVLDRQRRADKELQRLPRRLASKRRRRAGAGGVGRRGRARAKTDWSPTSSATWPTPSGATALRVVVVAGPPTGPRWAWPWPRGRGGRRRGHGQGAGAAGGRGRRGFGRAGRGRGVGPHQDR